MDQKSNLNEIQSQELSNAYKTLREYESILNILPDIIYKIDAEGKFVYLSNTVSMLGFEPEELLGKHFSVLIHPEDVPKISRVEVLPHYLGKVTGEEKAPKLFDETRTGRRITKKLGVRLLPKFARQEVVSDVSTVIEGEVTSSGLYDRFVQEQRKEFEGTSGRISLKREMNKLEETFIGTFSPFPDKSTEVAPRNKGLIGTIGFIRDISQLKQLEEKNHQLEEQLYHSKKMQTVGELAGNIAHDFNRLLGNMLRQTDIILSHSTASSQPMADSVLTIQKTIIQAADLNSRLLTFARKVKISDLPLNLHDVLTEIEHLLIHSFDKSFSIRREFSAPHSMIIGDANLLKNALINIAHNARDAMPSGGDLIFKTSNVGRETMQRCFPDQKITAEEYIAIAIQDSGLGMDEEVLDRIFEPFFTTKGLGKDSGLGLACVQGIVEMHDGLVIAESTKGVGSIITIYIPLVNDRMALESSDALDSKPPQETLEHIMIVDDEPIVLETQTLLLRELGYRVTSFPYSLSAIEYYRQYHSEVDLVILDFNMPHLNGKQCFLELKKINPEVKTVISTGCNIDSEAEELLKAGIGGLIQKPFPIKKLGQTIHSVLGKSRNSS